eukprot:scpid24426/ scgid35261/ 
MPRRPAAAGGQSIEKYHSGSEIPLHRVTDTSTSNIVCVWQTVEAACTVITQSLGQVGKLALCSFQAQWLNVTRYQDVRFSSNTACPELTRTTLACQTTLRW